MKTIDLSVLEKALNTLELNNEGSWRLFNSLLA
jgi:hypothetical protein